MRCAFVWINCCVLASLSFGAVPGAPGDSAKRTGDEIVVCGQMFHTGTRVILWSDPNGYDGSQYVAGPVTRPADGGAPTLVRGGDITLDQLREHVDQLVMHFDGCGNSRECFRVLQRRHLSIHFMCDLDGTIYQTVDLREDAYHATIANARSIGIEIANIGTFQGEMPASFKEWYRIEGAQTRITLPKKFGDGGIRTPNFVGRPARPQAIVGNVQGKLERQFDFTRQQYTALAHITATVSTVLPKVQLIYPRQKTRLGAPTTGPATQPVAGDPTTRASALADAEETGVLIPHALTAEQFATFQGVLGHYHVQINKDDPGPAFQWNLIIDQAKAMMTPAARAESAKWRNRPANSMPATSPATNQGTTEAQ